MVFATNPMSWRLEKLREEKKDWGENVLAGWLVAIE
jgi:hypothetical protein